jgi:hypothetical protein
MRVPFAKIVRETVAAERAAWRFERIAKHGGVVFVLPQMRRFRRRVSFREDRLGRVTTVPTVTAEVETAFAGKQHFAVVDHRWTKEIRFDDDDEKLRAAVTELVRVTDQLAARALRARVGEAPRLTKLFDRIERHFARWFRTVGAALPTSHFDEEAIAGPAFDAFQRWLAREQLLPKSARPTLWHWWRSGDPLSHETWAKRARVNAVVRAAIAKLR